MKNPFKLLWLWLKKQFRKRELKKRDEIYDDVTNILTKLNQEKATKQQELIDEIKANWRVISGQHYGSQYIPETHTKASEVFKAVNEEYFFRMEQLGVSMNKKFQFTCK
jgi:hypothetical protein